MIIRDLKRLDEYPDLVDNKGISSWFRLGLVDVTHRGILVILRNETLTKHKDGRHWRFTDYAAGECGEIKVVLLGRIPYEHIDSVDWEGDEYYGFPHIYCFFANKKQLYEYLALYTKTAPIATQDMPIYDEVASYDEVCRFSKKSKRFFRQSK